MRSILDKHPGAKISGPKYSVAVPSDAPDDLPGDDAPDDIRKAEAPQVTPKKEYKSGRGEIGEIRSEPCLHCLNSAIAGKLSLKGCFNNVLDGEITRRCWLCASSHSCTPIPRSLFTVGLAFMELFIDGSDKHKVS